MKDVDEKDHEDDQEPSKKRKHEESMPLIKIKFSNQKEKNHNFK